MISIRKRPEIDFQMLMNLCRYNEEALDMELNSWWCGTYGCLVGNDIAARYDNIPLLNKLSYEFCCVEYGLTKNESLFLFSNLIYKFGRLGYKNSGPRRKYTKESAIARVRKFIYYKLRKQEIMADDNARFQEGDWGLVDQVKEQTCVE
jgi:hypothetical protein